MTDARKMRNFVLEQAHTLLTPANSLPPTTETVRVFFISAFACGRPEDIACLRGIVDAIADPDWEFTGWGDLAVMVGRSE